MFDSEAEFDDFENNEVVTYDDLIEDQDRAIAEAMEDKITMATPLLFGGWLTVA